MWIASKIGFFSLVQKDSRLHVRGRKRRDLEQLATLLGMGPRQVEEWPSADYRWRILLPATATVSVLGALAGTVDYPNFKSAIAASPDQAEKLGAYHSLWQDLFDLQDSDRRRAAGAGLARGR